MTRVVFGAGTMARVEEEVRAVTDKPSRALVLFNSASKGRCGKAGRESYAGA